VRYMVAQMVEW